MVNYFAVIQVMNANSGTVDPSAEVEIFNVHEEPFIKFPSTLKHISLHHQACTGYNVYRCRSCRRLVKSLNAPETRVWPSGSKEIGIQQLIRYGRIGLHTARLQRSVRIEQPHTDGPDLIA